MRRRFPALWVPLGAVAIAAGLGLGVPPAQAQNMRPVLREDSEPLPRLKPRVPAAAKPAQPAAPEEPPALPPRLRPTSAVDNADPASVDFDADAEATPSGVRAGVRDGDMGAVGEAEAILDGGPDGATEEAEPYVNPDGRDPVQWDSRLPEDSDAFERPAAGYDVRAFGVELSPLDDRRPLALYRFEPWQPRGIRLGSFTVFPQADVGAGWMSNLFRSKPARADQALEFRPSLRAVSNWRTHALEVRATGGFSFFDTYPNEGDRAYALEARGRLDVTRRTQLSGSVLRDVTQEARGSLESRLRGGARADVEMIQGRVQLDQSFNRLGVQLRGSVLSRDYEDTALAGGGSPISNRDRNLRATEETARLSWTFKPTFIGFVEAGLNQRRFEAASALDGIKRDSDGERYRLGVGFGNMGNTLRGEASVGYGRQTPLDMRLESIDGLVVDANLAWRMSALTALLLRGSTDVTETTSLRSAGGFTRRASAEVRHAFARPLIGTASAGYATTSYQGILINENLTELGLGFEYYLGPEAVIYGRYQHSMLRTTAPTGDWDGDEVRIGVRIRQ